MLNPCIMSFNGWPGLSVPRALFMKLGRKTSLLSGLFKAL